MDDLTSKQTLDGMPVQVGYSVDDFGAISIESVIFGTGDAAYPVEAHFFADHILQRWLEAIQAERETDAAEDRSIGRWLQQQAWESTFERRAA